MKTSTGCSPLYQGYFTYTEGRPRECPTWHPDHAQTDFRAEWYQGWDEAAAFKAKEKAEGRRRLTLEAIEAFSLEKGKK